MNRIFLFCFLYKTCFRNACSCDCYEARMPNIKKKERGVSTRPKDLRKRLVELKQQNRGLIRKGKSLENEAALLRGIINNIPDCHIFFKDCNSRFIITNDFLLKLLGKKSMKEMVGKTDFDLFPKELAEQYYHDEQEIIRTGKPLLNRQEKTVDTAGIEYWLLTTKVPLYMHKGTIIGVAGVSMAIPSSSKFTGIVGVSRDITAIKKLEQEREIILQKLQEAFDKIRTLHGLIPICCSCKKIRNDRGYWQQVEVYVHEHSQVDFTHSYCPECAEEALAEVRKPQ